METLLALLLGVSLLTPTQLAMAQEIKAVADAYDVNAARMISIAWCESHLSSNPNLRVLDTNGRYSYGIFQFQKQTFFGHGGRNIKSPEDQMVTAAKMMKDEGWNHWKNCNHKTLATLNAGAYALNSTLTNVEPAQNVIVRPD